MSETQSSTDKRAALKKKYSIGLPLAELTVAQIEKNTQELKEDEYIWPEGESKKSTVAQTLKTIKEQLENIKLWHSYYSWCLLNKAICFPEPLRNPDIRFQINNVIALQTLDEEDLDKVRAYLKFVEKELDIKTRELAKVEKEQ